MRVSVLTSLVAALAYPLGASARVNMQLSAKHMDAADASDASSPPSKDRFYMAPKGFESASPGSILRYRPVPHKLRVGPSLDTGYYQKAFQILYRTTDGLGDPSVAVQTVIVPKDGNPKQLLSYQTFYDSPDNDCSPSYTLQAGQNQLNTEGIFISSALRQGWYVTVSDYEGTEAAFTVGRQSGHAVLDGIKATLKSHKFTQLADDPRVALFGYSGGALASEWAVELQPTYAPNLKIDGAAFGGLTPNISSVLLMINKTPNSGLIAAGINGFANQYKNVSKYLHNNIIPSKAKSFNTPKRQCDYSNLNGKNILSYFKDGADALQSPLLKSVVQHNGIMGLTNTPKIPLYVFRSIGDEISSIQDNDALIKKYCNDGANIRYVRNKFGGHETEFFTGVSVAFSWIKDRLNGEKADKGCSTRTVDIRKIPTHTKIILGRTVYEEMKTVYKSLT